MTSSGRRCHRVALDHKKLFLGCSIQIKAVYLTPTIHKDRTVAAVEAGTD
jgi:hypothetical protein